MSTLIDNVNRIYTDKEAIKQAIIAKGVAIPNGTSLDEYAALIAKINTGVDTSDGVLDKNLMGIGQIGYANGVKVAGNVPIAKAGSVVTTGPYATNDGHTVICSPYYNNNNEQVGVTVQYANILMQPSGASGVNIATGGSEMAKKIGLTADKIVSGNSILGVTGTGSGGSGILLGMKSGTVSNIGGTMTTGQTFKNGTAVAWQAASNETNLTINLGLNIDNAYKLYKCNTVTYIVILGTSNVYNNPEPATTFRISRGYSSGTTTAQYWYLSSQLITSTFYVNSSTGNLDAGIRRGVYGATMKTTRTAYPYNRYHWDILVSDISSDIITIRRCCYKETSATANSTYVNDTLCLYCSPLDLHATIFVVGYYI